LQPKNAAKRIYQPVEVLYDQKNPHSNTGAFFADIFVALSADGIKGSR
jgi:hypothetical protein